MSANNVPEASDPVPVINLSRAPGAGETWDRPSVVVYLWALAELIFVTNRWQVSSRLRVSALRLFGARIGKHVIMRPGIRVRFPWKLEIGDRSWIGEGVWFHNQNQIQIGNDVVVSQETFLTTGSHAHRRDMALVTAPIVIADGVWVTSRCMVLGGAWIGQSALVRPMSVVTGRISPNRIVGGSPLTDFGARFVLPGNDVI